MLFFKLSCTKYILVIGTNDLLKCQSFQSGEKECLYRKYEQQLHILGSVSTTASVCTLSLANKKPTGGSEWAMFHVKHFAAAK